MQKPYTFPVHFNPPTLTNSPDAQSKGDGSQYFKKREE
jgi:hypothetical protein